MTATRSPSDTPETVAEAIVAEAQNKGISGAAGKYDYIRSKVTECWK